MRTIEQLEQTCIEMNYIQAFLYLTLDENVPHNAAIEWLCNLAVKYPQSRLAVHVRMNILTLEGLLG